jgi:hypothetical protein
MPNSRSMRPNRQTPGSLSRRRKPCPLCNNLDPRGHASSVYQTEVAKSISTSLTLVLDALSLSRIKSPAEGGCRFCYVLIQALDAFFDDWRGSRQRINVDLKEKGSIKVGIDGVNWKGQLVEIFAGAGRISCLVLILIYLSHNSSPARTDLPCHLSETSNIP